MQEFFKAFIAFVEVILCITGLRPVENVANYSNTKYVPQEVASPMTIVENGKSDFVIVTNDNPDATIITASKEIQDYIEKISGAKAPLISFPSYGPADAWRALPGRLPYSHSEPKCFGALPNGCWQNSKQP